MPKHLLMNFNFLINGLWIIVLLELNTIDEDSVMLSIDKVIALCTNDNKEIQLNALCYLQHLIFNNNQKKLEVR